MFDEIIKNLVVIKQNFAKNYFFEERKDISCSTFFI
jgi:hypothetical protein